MFAACDIKIVQHGSSKVTVAEIVSAVRAEMPVLSYAVVGKCAKADSLKLKVLVSRAAFVECKVKCLGRGSPHEATDVASRSRIHAEVAIVGSVTS